MNFKLANQDVKMLNGLLHFCLIKCLFVELCSVLPQYTGTITSLYSVIDNIIKTLILMKYIVLLNHVFVMSPVSSVAV